MSVNQVILAKSSGVTLVEHTNNLRHQFREHAKVREYVADKYTRMTGGKDLKDSTLQAIQWHDAGKKHPSWQSACQKDHQELKAWEASGKVGKKPKGKNLRGAHIRHEMASLVRMDRQEPNVPQIVRAAIAAHHGKLSERHEGRWLNDQGGEFKHLWRPFKILSKEIEYLTEFDKAILHRYEYAGPRAMLQLADHRASAQEDGDVPPKFKSFSYQFPDEWTKRGVQEVIEKVIKENPDEQLILLRAPTGAGKTDAALLWAQYQIKNEKADRLVIAMPTRFTANSLAITNAEKLSSTGLYHSSAWYQGSKQKNSISKDQLDTEDLARLLETPITVTTLDHLCICLTGTREDHHSIFFNLAHSCVVIDEADFYDEFTQANLLVLLRALKLLQVPVLLMSATLPQSACELYGVSKIYEDASDNQRIRCHLKPRKTPVIKPSDIADLLAPTLVGRPTIIYANTVQRAQRYYRWLINNGMTQDNVLLYHSRFTVPDKADIEEKLTTMLGKEAWEKQEAHGVAILTQIGELSVNISADYMLSELCPLDRLVQRIGRLARFPDDKGVYHAGELHLLLPYKKNKEGEASFYPAPYGSYKPKVGWLASPMLAESAKMLVEKSYSAEDFVKMVNELYNDLPTMASDARENQRLLKEMVGKNWLILSGGAVSDEGDEAAVGTERWRCRDIDPQKTILVGLNGFSQFDDSPWLRNRREWHRRVLEHGINCRTYEFDQAESQGFLTQTYFAIGDEERAESEEAWLVAPGKYDDKLGLCFEDPEDEEDG